MTQQLSDLSGVALRSVATYVLAGCRKIGTSQIIKVNSTRVQDLAF